MNYNKIVYGSRTLIDLTEDTVSSEKLLKGYTAHDKTGSLIVGTAPEYVMIDQNLYEYYSLEDSNGNPIFDFENSPINGKKVWKFA